jgi:hypothetical protein
MKLFMLLLFSVALPGHSETQPVNGLKTTNFGGKSAAVVNAAAAGPQLTPEQTQLMLETIKQAKESQAAQQKFLDELEADE